MDDYLSAPGEVRSPFLAGWASALPLIWQMLLAPSDEADAALRNQLQDYYSGPHWHHLGDAAAPGAEEPAAAAAIYATESYCHRNAQSASSGALTLVSAAGAKADALSGKDLMSPEAEAREILFEQKELDRLNAALAVLEREGVTQESLKELRAIFALD
jgi:hypothetical protein